MINLYLLMMVNQNLYLQCTILGIMFNLNYLKINNATCTSNVSDPYPITELQLFINMLYSPEKHLNNS